MLKLLFQNKRYVVSIFLTILITFCGQNLAYGINVADRTPQVRDAIVVAAGVDTAAEVTAAHLAAITSLNLSSKNITALKAGDFQGLTALQILLLNNNQLTQLPENLFNGLTALQQLSLDNNAVQPLPLTVSLEKVSDGEFLVSLEKAGTPEQSIPIDERPPVGADAEFKAVASTGAPFDIILPIHITNGRIAGGVTTLKIPQGSVESETVTVFRTLGTRTPVTGDIGTLPGLPINHSGYGLVKSSNLPLVVIGQQPNNPPGPPADTPGNNAPVFTDGTRTTRTVAENTASGENIGTPVAALDVDSGDTLSYSLGGTDAASFSIVSTSGQLQTSAPLDYETKNAYTVTVSVSDGKGGSDSIDVTINVSNVNEAPRFTEGDSTTRTVAENTVSGTNIGSAVAATDVDANTTLSYSLSGTDAASFSIVGTTGQLQTRAALNFESKTSYSVTITVSDGNLTDSIDVTINVSNVNEAPRFTEGDSTTRTVAENTVSGANIGSAVAATDEDNDTLTYTLGGTDAASFRIVSTSGQLRTRAALDYETKNAYAVRVSVSDSKGGSDSISVAINVTDVNETPPKTQNNAPIFTEGTSTTRDIAENTATGTNIGTPVAATDADGNTLTYGLGGTDAASFSIVGTTGQLQTRAALNYETKDAYSVTVSVSDGSLTDSIDVTINVSNVNEAPRFTEGDSTTRTVAENTVSGTNIGSAVAATDVDANTTLTYSLSGTDAASFSIVSTSGQLQTSAPLDYETKNAYTVRVSVSDGKGGSDSIPVTINVSNVNEAPRFTEGSSTTRDIAENTASGQNIGTAVAATDADNDTLEYTLGGTNAASFNIVSTTGQLQTRATLDYETKSSYSVTLTVSDGNGGTDTIAVTINVTDVDERNLDCWRSAEVKAAIVAAAGVDSWDKVTEAHLKAITSLDISNVSDSFDIYSEFGNQFCGLTSLTHLDLSDNKIDGFLGNLDKGTFDGEGLSSLTHLDLSGNEIGIISEGAFEGLSQLTHLDLSWNNLDRIKTNNFKELSNLTHLNLEGNRKRNVGTVVSHWGIVKVEENAFAGLSSLMHLDLSHCNIPSLPDNLFDGLSNLTDLDLTANDLTSLPADVFNGLSALTTLSLAYNDLTSLPADVFDGLSALTTLILHSNRTSHIGFTRGSLTSLPADVFDGLSALKTLLLSANGLTSLPADVFDGLSALETLNLGNNNLTSLPADVFDGLSNLTELKLSGHNLTSLPADVFDGLSNLTELHLSGMTFYNSIGNKLTSLPPDVFDGLSNLTKLYLGGNKLTSLPADLFDGLSALKTLLLYGNGLTSLPADLFDGLSALEGLELYSNGLTSLPADLFDGLSNLTYLDLRENKLTSLPSGVFDELSSLTKLYIRGNPITDYAPLRKLKAANPGVSIDIDINNNIPVFTDGDHTTRSIAENTAAGTNIGTAITATDTDTGDTLTYTLGGTDAKSFSIVSTSGQLQTKAALDYETKSSYRVTVDVSDGNNGLDRITVTINVTDVAAEAPPVQTSLVIPDKTALLTNFPNPFNPETWIPYQLAKPAEVTLTIYDIRGVVVRELKLGHQPAGVYHSRSRAIRWDGSNEFGEKVATGVYFYTLRAGDFTATRKLLIRK